MDGSITTDSNGELLSEPPVVGEKDSPCSLPTLWPPLHCNLTSLLTMNCRAKAQGLAKSFQQKMKNNSVGGRQSQDKIPLTLKDLECNRSASMDETSSSDGGINIGGQTMHVVTSEPTINTLFESLKDLPVVADDEDSDQHYDFDLESPSEGNGISNTEEKSTVNNKRQPLSNKKVTKWSESSDKPESGCVTSVTSPVSSRGEDHHINDSNGSPEAADLRAVLDKLTISTLSDVQQQSYSIFSGIDSGLYTEADFNMDITDSYINDLNENSNKNQNYLAEVKELPSSEFLKKSRRRSFDLDIKSYLQDRLKSPPGYRSNYLCGSKEQYNRIESFEQFKCCNNENVIRKCDSEVIYTGARASVKTKLFASSPTRNNNINHEAFSIPIHAHVLHHVMQNPFDIEVEREESWRNNIKTLADDAKNIWHSQLNDKLFSSNRETGYSVGVCSAAPHSLHDGRKGVLSVDSHNSENKIDEVKIETEKHIKMRDECEPQTSYFGRRRRRSKGTEGQSKSDDNSEGKSLSGPSNLNLHNSNDEPSSSGSTPKTYDSSGPSSPISISGDLSSRLLLSETVQSHFPESALHGVRLDECDTEEVDTVKEKEDDDEEPILEGKFKNISNYEESIKRLCDNEEERLDLSVTTVIQLDENDMSEPEEDISSHDEVSQEDIDTHLSQLTVDHPILSVLQPSSDDSSRESSYEPDKEELKQRIKRSSSLKCGKTPPGTPGTNGSKKIVRFADSLGLDLANIRTFLEGVPNVPISAYGDLEIPTEEEPVKQASPIQRSSKKMLMPLFQQPSSIPGFMDRVRNQKVILESISIGDDMGIRGFVRVLNISYHKHVAIRYTFDGWRNFHEALASYVTGSCDGFSDKFSFLLWGNFLPENGSLTFCVKYTSNGIEFWDNNRGANYVVQCYCNQNIRPSSNQQSLHGGHSFTTHQNSRHFGGSTFENSPPTPSYSSWNVGFF